MYFRRAGLRSFILSFSVIAMAMSFPSCLASRMPVQDASIRLHSQGVFKEM